MTGNELKRVREITMDDLYDWLTNEEPGRLINCEGDMTCCKVFTNKAGEMVINTSACTLLIEVA